MFMKELIMMCRSQGNTDKGKASPKEIIPGRNRQLTVMKKDQETKQET